MMEQQEFDPDLETGASAVADNKLKVIFSARRAT